MDAMKATLSEPRRVTVLGSTGSVGANTLDLLERNPGSYLVEALTADGGQVRVFDNFGTGLRSNLDGLRPAPEIVDGDLADAPTFEEAFDRFVASAAVVKPGLPKELLRVLARRHGSGLDDVLEGVKTVADLGRHFGGYLYETEVRYLMRDEWAFEANDVLWRRTKEGLHMTAAEREAFARWMAELRPNSDLIGVQPAT